MKLPTGDIPTSRIGVVEPLVLSISDAQIALGGVGRSYLYEEIKAGRLRVLKFGKRTFIAYAELERFVEAQGA